MITKFSAVLLNCQKKNQSGYNLLEAKWKTRPMEARGFDTADCTFFLSGHIFFKDIARGFAISHMFTLHKMDYKFPHSFCKAHQERHATDYSPTFTTVPMLSFHKMKVKGWQNTAWEPPLCARINNKRNRSWVKQAVSELLVSLPSFILGYCSFFQFASNGT